jgi:hypothetical protein
VLPAGDSDGKVHLLDPRAAGGALSSLQLHKPGSKVNAVAVNPAGGASVVLTAGTCAMWRVCILTYNAVDIHTSYGIHIHTC